MSGTGIVPISKDGMVKMTLPNYEGRSWGVAVEDIDDTTKVGSVVLYPGYETDGKIYSTLLDVQNDGRTSQLADGIKASIEVSNIKITTDLAGTVEAGNDVTDGTTLYINFDASEDGTSVTVSPSLPFEITTNGDYEFTLTNASGKTKKYVVKVSNYKVATVANTIELGDYIDYIPDSENSYVLDSSLTGYEEENGKVLTPKSLRWRVWTKNSDGTITIVPTWIGNEFYLKGLDGFLNSNEVLEGVCDIYANEKLGVTPDDVRSMKIEDMESISPGLVATRDAYNNVESRRYPKYMETNMEIWKSAYKQGKFYIELDGKTIRREPYEATSTNQIVLPQTAYYAWGIRDKEWKKLGGEGYFSTYSYSMFFDSGRFYFNSPRVYLNSTSEARFSLLWASNNEVDRANFYNSLGSYTNQEKKGVKPMVTLKGNIKIDTSDSSRNGRTYEKAWKLTEN